MKKDKIIVLIATVAIAFFILNSIPVKDFIWRFREFTNPNLSDDIEKEWNNKSSEFLLRQLKSWNYVYMGIATTILCERNDERAVPILIKLMKSKNKDIRDMAFINAVASFKSKKAINICIDIIKQENKHRDYIIALRALSIIKYEPAYPYIIELAKSENTDRSYAVTMLEYFGKSESIPLLEDIAKNDPEWYIRDKAEEAIKKIKASK